MFAQYILTRPIMEICEEAGQRPVALISNRWWDQELIHLAWAWSAAAAMKKKETEETYITAGGVTD